MTRTALIAGLVAWVVTLGVPLGADAGAVIVGTVKNKAGQPLPGSRSSRRGRSTTTSGTAAAW